MSPNIRLENKSKSVRKAKQNLAKPLKDFFRSFSGLVRICSCFSHKVYFEGFKKLCPDECDREKAGISSPKSSLRPILELEEEEEKFGTYSPERTLPKDWGHKRKKDTDRDTERERERERSLTSPADRGAKQVPPGYGGALADFLSDDFLLTCFALVLQNYSL